jgi:hypothetical protein
MWLAFALFLCFDKKFKNLIINSLTKIKGIYLNLYLTDEKNFISNSDLGCRLWF